MNASNASPPQTPDLDRRAAIKWMLAATAAVALSSHDAFGQPAAPAPAHGYGGDPNLLKDYTAGELWPLTLTATERRATTALCDLIIPADADSPSASQVGVPDFIDEWISAPYPAHVQDRKIITEGLAWLDAESQRRFTNPFSNLILKQARELAADICYVPNAKPEHRQGAKFFKRFRDLAAGGYYTTSEGMKAIGYTGNVPLTSFDPPTSETLARLGLLAKPS